ncbi:MAG TPA: hypothetical protein ENI15_19235 [Spirochaetes bacterium]|nr:hypothetical protein [Spirochaetota bacterium]
MNRYLRLHLIVLINFLFTGCTGLDIIAQDIKETQVEKKDELSGGDRADELKSRQDLKPLLISVMRLNYFDMSFSHFKSFALEGDPVFGDFIFLIFAGEDSPYEKGTGTLLVSKTEGGAVYSTLERALVEINPDGSRWWQVNHTIRDDSIFYEVLVSRPGIPLIIRYIHPETGKIHETTLPASEAFKSALKDPDESKLKDRVQQRIEAAFDRDYEYTFSKPELVEQKKADSSIGTIKAFHFRDRSTQKTGINIDYWVSKDIPGNIMKIVYKSPQQAILYRVDLVKIGKNYTDRIQDSEIEVREVLEAYSEGGPLSEGSRYEPVKLQIGMPHNGMVGPSGTSFYQVTAERRADIYIEVIGPAGEAGIFYYGKDLTFEEWRTISDEAPLLVEDYFVEPGTTLYFTIVDFEDDFSEDEYSLGESYVISITEDFILSQTGIMMQGEFDLKAFKLNPDRTYFHTLDKDGINYYKATIAKGPNLRISVLNLPEQADLLWIDVQNGTYSRVHSTREDGVKEMTIHGLTAGAVCFFYIAGDVLNIEENLFKISIEEFTDPE